MCVCVRERERERERERRKENKPERNGGKSDSFRGGLIYSLVLKTYRLQFLINEGRGTKMRERGR